jgi:predicted metal-dependent enzyme (double-stranded beta helix superfamily)
MDGTQARATTDDMLPAAARFVGEMKALFAEGLDETALWMEACERLRVLLADPDLRRHAGTWPESLTAGGRPSNLLFYEDPEHGFVLNALIKAPGAKSSVHDHGPSWTLYGVLEGAERVTRFSREDGRSAAGPAQLRETGRHDVVPGYIDFVPPWEIHQETNGAARTVGFIVRSRRSGTFVQNRFDRSEGTVTQYDGPVQVPYRLGW